MLSNPSAIPVVASPGEDGGAGAGLPPPAPPLVRHQVVIDRVRLSYLERPSAAGEGASPILLLHGLIASGETFAALIRELPQNRRIVALDLPGRDEPGRSTPSDLTLSGLARLVCDFAAAIGLEDVILLGHSHGGAIALQIAASLPGTLSGLILMCPAHPFLYRERPLIAFYNSWAGSLVARTFRFFPTPMQGIGFRRLLGARGRRAVIDFRPYRASLGHPETARNTLRLIRTWNDDMEALRKQMTANPIAAPTLFLWGDSDPVVPLSTAEELHPCLKQWQHFTLPGIGHLPNDEDPQGCGSLIRTWLIWKDTGRVAPPKPY